MISNFFILQNDSNLEATLSRYQFETSNFNIRLNQVKKQEDELVYQKEEVAQQKKVLEREFEQLRQASLEIQKRSEEVEKFAKVFFFCTWILKMIIKTV